MSVTSVGAGPLVTASGGAVAVDGNDAGGALTVVDVLTVVGVAAVAVTGDRDATPRRASSVASAPATVGHAAHTNATPSAIRKPIRFRLTLAGTGRR